MTCFWGWPKIRSVFFIFLLVYGFLPFAATSKDPAPDQAKKKPPQDLLQHEVTVTLKLVQANVVDPEGKPAPDLQLSDFVLYDNGKLQEITEFEKHFLSVPGARPEAGVPVAEREVASVLNRKFVFLVDYKNNDLEGIGKSRAAILRFLDSQAQPSDELALFSFRSPWGLVLHEYLTSDHQRIQAALRKITGIPEISEGWGSYFIFGHSGENVLSDPAAISIAPMIMGSSGGGGLVYCLKDLAKALRRIPGQKNIILFSRGIGKDKRDAEFEEMCRDLATANCPVFSVNTVTGMEKIRIQPENSLENVSALTGGRYFPDVNYESKISEDIQEATSNFYVLGYSIASNWDGKFHEIKVEVKKLGYKVYAQRGYFNPLPFSKLSAVEKHLHLLDLALGEKENADRRLDIPLAVLPFSTDQVSNIVLIAEIPVQRIRETIGEENELISLVFDRSRSIVDSRREVVKWGPNYKDKVYHFSVLSLTPGNYDCRVVLRNLETGAGALALGTASVPERKEKGIQLFPPLLLRLEKGTLYLETSPPEKAPQRVGSSSIPEIFSFDGNIYSPYIDKELPRGAEVWASVRCAHGGSSPGGLKLAAYLLDELTAEKTFIPLTILDEKEKAGVNAFFLHFRVPELEPDEYIFCLVAEDPASGEMSIVGCGYVIQ